MAGDTKGFPAGNKSNGSSCKGYAFVALIILVAIGLRTYTVHFQSVWSDEYVSVAYLNASTWSEFQAGYRQHDRYMPPVYHVLLYLWAHLFEISTLSLRLLSVLFAVASLFLMYVVGKRLIGTKGALVALTLFAFSPEQIYHAQGIRCYSLVVLLGLASAWTFLHMVHGGQIPWWIANAAVNTLLIWTHLCGILLVLTWGLGLLLWLRPYWKKIGVWALGQAIAIVPLAGIVLLTTNHQMIMGKEKEALFNPLMFLATLIVPFFRDASYLLNALPSEYAVQNGLTLDGQNGTRLFLLGTSLFLFLLLMAVFAYTCVLFLSYIGSFQGGLHKKNLSSEQESPLLTTPPWKSPNSFYFLLLWFVVPALTLIVPVCLVSSSALVPRYTIFAAPSLHLLIAYGLMQLHTKYLRQFLLFSILACMMVLGIGATVLPIRGNYLALGKLLATDCNGHPVAVLGDSPLLASQIAYNGHLDPENIHQVYSVKAVSEWLDENKKRFKEVWLILEETHCFENTATLHSIEQLLTEKKLSYVRSCFHGPQILLAFDIHTDEVVTTEEVSP